ncbi:exodeoxyribonuclease VII large subunit [Ningiella sp. W23]|uniref:exodeoxyribonuclease VII large subunit n=1 Tax=Ningiella sp. W23 TaxID=3023715 RepID=UPI0037571443
MFATSSQVSILTVSKLNRFAKRVLESEIGLVWVSGEISNFVAASSGHWYFTLKDSQAQVKTAMFKGANQRCSFRPKAGDKVVVRANISLYEARGDYQLIAQHLEPEGIGQLKQAYEALKLALKEEGLFEQAHKQSIPPHITKLGVISSPTGAAIHDILHVLARRNPAIEVIIYPSMVQGEQAAKTIVEQIRIANVRNEVDALIVGRGGGSLEDLWPFNEQSVARAIYDSKLPIVSAVGHEVDVTIADFVADMRCPTPSAAAETISTDSQELKRSIEKLRQSLHNAVRQRLLQNEQRLDIAVAKADGISPARMLEKQALKLRNITQRLEQSHPERAIEQSLRRNAELSTRLSRSMEASISSASVLHRNISARLSRLEPSSKIAELKQRQGALLTSLIRYQNELLESKSQQLAAQSSLLNSVSPLATLSRGYSITYKEVEQTQASTTESNEIVRHVSQLSQGDTLVTKIQDGELRSQVLEVMKTEAKS